METGFGTVVVIGGNGWLGSYIVSLLVKIMKTQHSTREKEMTVHSIDIRSPRHDLQSLHEGETENHICDISNREMVSKLIHKLNPKVIFHVASVIDLRVGPTPVMDAVNVDGTRYLIESVLSLPQDQKRYLIYTSSIDVVATTHGTENANEWTPTVLENPSNGYKRTKTIAENLVLSIHSENLRCCSLRPGHIFGPGDAICESSSNSPAMGPPSARMAFTYVENTAYGHILAAYRLFKEKHLVIDHLSSIPMTTLTSFKNYKPMLLPSLPQSSRQYLTQTPLFIYDYNVNFCDMYHSFAGRSPSSSRISVRLLEFLISVVEFIESVLVSIFHKHFLQSHPFLTFSSSVLEACGSLTIDSHRAAELLQDSSPSLMGNLFKEFDQKEAIERTRYWLRTGKLPQENP
jgi:nucleoside-diphosphate-sugar epimerase